MLKQGLNEFHNFCYLMIAHYVCKKTLWSFFMDRVQMAQNYRATMRRQLVFTTKFPEIPGTH